MNIISRLSTSTFIVSVILVFRTSRSSCRTGAAVGATTGITVHFGLALSLALGDDGIALRAEIRCATLEFLSIGSLVAETGELRLLWLLSGSGSGLLLGLLLVDGVGDQRSEWHILLSGVGLLGRKFREDRKGAGDGRAA